MTTTPLCSSCGEEYGPGMSVPASAIAGVCASCAEAAEEAADVEREPTLAELKASVVVEPGETLRKATPGPFEPGQRVRFLGGPDGEGEGEGPRGTVVNVAQDIDDVWLYLVEWDDGQGNGRLLVEHVLEAI